MTTPPRPRLRSFLRALAGVLLLAVGSFVGLGWVLTKHYAWVERAIGNDRASDLWNQYMSWMVKLLPRDGDRDGICDGAELLLETDPRNPADCSDYIVHCLSRPAITAYCGERLATCWVQEPAPWNQGWPEGFAVIVRADEPVLLPKGGNGPPTKGPLKVSANARGEVEFDLLAEKVFQKVRVEIGSAANKKTSDRVSASFPGWRTPPISISMDGGPAHAVFHRSAEGDQTHVIQWAAIEGWTGKYVIEASPEGEESWQQLRAVEATQTEWSFGHPPWTFFPGYNGPLKFRVVPVRDTPP